MITHRLRHQAFALATVFAFSALAPKPVHAEEVSATGKAIAGGALLGGEIVTITEALIGVRGPGWYILGALVGAGGGGVGGFFLEKKNADGYTPTNGRVQTYMLAGGLGLLIPAIVLSLNANRYQTQEGAKEDNAPAAEPGSEAGKSARRAPTTTVSKRVAMRESARPVLPPSLVNVHQGNFKLGVPTPEVTPMFSVEDQMKYGVKQQTEVKVPVVEVKF